jgi:hypothetical protein
MLTFSFSFNRRNPICSNWVLEGIKRDFMSHGEARVGSTTVPEVQLEVVHAVPEVQLEVAQNNVLILKVPRYM